MEDYTIEGTFCHLFIEPQKTYWERTVVYRFTSLACDTDFIEKNYEWNMVFLYRDVYLAVNVWYYIYFYVCKRGEGLHQIAHFVNYLPNHKKTYWVRRVVYCFTSLWYRCYWEKKRRIYYCIETCVGGKCSILNIFLVGREEEDYNRVTFCQLFVKPKN